MNMRLFVLFKM